MTEEVHVTDSWASTGRGLLISGLLLIAAAIAFAIFGEDGFGAAIVGLLTRSGAILAAVGLVLSSMKKPSATTLIVAAVILIVVAARPALIWAAVIGGVIFLITKNRQALNQGQSPKD